MAPDALGAALWDLTGIGIWAVARRDDDTAVGHVGFFDLLRDCDPSIVGEAEIGWIFAPAAHGNGYAREACERMLAWFDEHLASGPSGR